MPDVLQLNAAALQLHCQALKETLHHSVQQCSRTLIPSSVLPAIPVNLCIGVTAETAQQHPARQASQELHAYLHPCGQ